MSMSYREIRDLMDRTFVNVPEGESGPWKVSRMTVSEKDADWANLRAAISMGGRGAHRTIKPGIYTSLTRGGTMVMSDVPAEKNDHYKVISEATGRVIICGLGLGWVIEVISQKPEVEHITVIEISQDVINLVGAHYKAKLGDRLTIINADAYEWKPPKGERWNVAWFDVWDHICEDNWEGMKKLRRKFARRADWKGAWCEDDIRYQVERSRRQEREMAMWR